MYPGMPRLSLLSILTCLTTLFTPAAAENPTDSMELHFTAGFSTDDLLFGSRMEYDLVEIPEGNRLHDPGQPSIPFVKWLVALPSGMEATGVHVLALEEEILAGEYVIFPSQQAIPYRRSTGETQFVPPDERTYRSREPYPARYVELTGQADLAGQGIAILKIYPVHYVPAENRLLLVTSIELVIDGKGGYECGDYLPDNLSESGRESYERMIREAVVNPDDIELRFADSSPRTTRLEPGEHEYVIITESGWMDDFQSLADWKSIKGVPALVVDRDWIYSEYSGSDDAEKIRAFVEDAHSTWGTIYFLLGGDTNTIPYHTFSNTVGSLPSDTYYGDYDSDWICEVHIGRASVKSTDEIGTFMDKVFTYEKNPPLTDYIQRAGFFGFDLLHHDSGEGEGVKVAIDNLYIPSDWDVNTVYDRYSGNHRIDVIGEIDSGHNLLNLDDHCAWDCLGVGEINHRYRLLRSDMDNLANGTRQSIFYVTGCDPCAFDHDDCIGEHFVRNENGGGVAFIGNSRFGFYSGYDDDYYSARYDRYFFRSLFEQNHYRLGECFSDHKNDAYESDPYYEYLFQGLTLLGDPELPIWTENPKNFDSVICPDSIPVGDQVVTVQVWDDDSPVRNARVCLMKEAEVYTVGTTGPDGSVDLAIAPMSSGRMSVTVTKRNYLPFEGDCTVSGEYPNYLVTLVPDSTVAIRGDMFGFEVIVTNNSNSTIIADYWTDIILGNGNPYPGNPVWGPFTAPLAPLETKQGVLRHRIPPNTPLETYTCYGRVGLHPDVVWAEDCFEVTVVDP